MFKHGASADCFVLLDVSQDKVSNASRHKFLPLDEFELVGSIGELVCKPADVVVIVGCRLPCIH